MRLKSPWASSCGGRGRKTSTLARTYELPMGLTRKALKFS